MRNPPRILAVDDVPANLEILKVRLEGHGYEVMTAADGEEALARVREVEPDLVLLDIMMPKLDGISVLKQLKQEAGGRFVPVDRKGGYPRHRRRSRGGGRRLHHQAV